MTTLLAYQLESTDDYIGALKAMENSNDLILRLNGKDNALLYQSITLDTDDTDIATNSGADQIRG